MFVIDVWFILNLMRVIAIASYRWVIMQNKDKDKARCRDHVS